MPAFRGHFSVQGSAVGGLSYKVKKMCLDTFSLRARLPAPIFNFGRVRVSGTQCLYRFLQSVQ